jgi:hypothetical protein
LIAVVDDTREPFERRLLNWDLHNLPVPADILVYTAMEWVELQKRTDRTGPKELDKDLLSDRF